VEKITYEGTIMNSWKARRPPACEPPFRTFWTRESARSSVGSGGCLTGYGKDVGLLGASQVGDVGVERDTLLGSCGLCDGHGDTEDGVGTQLLLVLCAIELDEGRGNGVVDVGDSLGDTLAAPLGLVAIAKLAGLVGASGGAGRNDGTVQAGFGDDVDLDGWVTLNDMSKSMGT
jgi:hypothetical protein